jgi:hypothetical protein
MAWHLALYCTGDGKHGGVPGGRSPGHMRRRGPARPSASGWSRDPPGPSDVRVTPRWQRASRFRGRVVRRAPRPPSGARYMRMGGCTHSMSPADRFSPRPLGSLHPLHPLHSPRCHVHFVPRTAWRSSLRGQIHVYQTVPEAGADRRTIRMAGAPAACPTPRSPTFMVSGCGQGPGGGRVAGQVLAGRASIESGSSGAVRPEPPPAPGAY